MDRRSAQQQLARRGEDEARIYLEARGYELCAQNLRVGSDEADLVMRASDGETLVIVEVKTRSDPRACPEVRVDVAKERSLIRLARTLASRGRFHGPMRIDVLAVTLAAGLAPGSAPSIRWFQNAVLGSGRAHSRGK